ncbi:MAG: DinB family protein [Cytophagales bacterium]|nr:DinB family protein [Cytophagales bacterium]
MKSEQLIQNLIEQTRQILNKAKRLEGMDAATLTWKHDPNAWNILECLEHLNLYGDYYLPEIEQSIKKSTIKSVANFRSGWLGNYFAKSMLPKEKLNKMKTFKDKNPINRELNKTTLEKFIAQQEKLLNLLNTSQQVDLNKIRIKTSISNLVRLKLGDTFQFYINHIIRHLAQIDNLLTAQKSV